MAGECGDSFDAVFKAHFRDIYGYVAFRLAPAPDAGDAQDLTQDVFLAAYAAWGGFRGDTTALQWLRAIARRKVADYFGQSSRTRMSVPIEAAAGMADAPVDHGALERAELLAAVMRAIPRESAELLEEKYLDGLSVRQIARRHGRTEKAVESALTRVRAMVREKALRLRAHAGDLS